MEERIRKPHHVWMVSSMLAIAVSLSAISYGVMGAVRDGWFHCPKPAFWLAADRNELQAVQSMQAHQMPSRSWQGPAEEEEAAAASSSCAGRYIYIYDLPPFFNQKIVDDCRSADPPWVYIHCEDLTNRGLGERIVLESNDSLSNILRPLDAWYKTHQFILELMYHERFRHYDCLTDDPEKAVFSYIPFYSALDLTQKLFGATVGAKDRACQRLIGWLQGSRHWERTGGKNHVLLLGRIVWDYTRREFEDGWGNPLISLPEMENVTKLTIERSHAHEDQRAIPYPTSFHPSSDDEITSWQRTILSSKRDSLVLFAGAPRSDKILAGSIRSELMRQCSNAASQSLCSHLSCSIIDCERKPQLLTQAFLNAVFCLQPPGDSATRRGVFDCLVAGSIPVFFDQDTAYRQYKWHLPENSSSYSVFMEAEAVVNGTIDVIQTLQHIPVSTIASMQQTINAFLPNLLYTKPGSNLNTYKDAFDITLQNLLQTFTLESSNLD